MSLPSSSDSPSPEEKATAGLPPAQVEWLQTVELDYSPDDAPPAAATVDGNNNNNNNNSNNTPEIHCFNCGDVHTKLLKCGKCCVVSYCQKECQVHDWKKGGHKVACKAYKRVGPSMTIRTDEEKNVARTEIFAKIRLYACPYAVHKLSELGKGFLFLQSSCTLAESSLPIPKDSYGRTMPPRSLLLHYLTLGEYDSEVCRDDFELAIVRTKLKEAVESYDEETQIVILARFRCGNLSVGITPIVPEFNVCRKLGRDYYADLTAGALQLNLDDM